MSKTPRYIDEGDALETKYTPAQPAFASTGIQLALDMDIHGLFKFQSSMIVDDTMDEQLINERLDMMRRIGERQRTVVEHRMYRFEHANLVTTLNTLPKLQAEWIEKRSSERRIMEASWQAAWIAGRRGEYRQTEAQRSALDEFDRATQKKLDEFQHMRDEYPARIANLEDKRNRCRRVIDELAEKTDLLDELLPETALIKEMLPPDIQDAAE